jgi:hypothetical protein
MSPNEQYKFLVANHIHDGLLREFAIKGLWVEAIKQCEAGIQKRQNEIEKLKTLIEMIVIENETETIEP